ncbi:D-alanyl-D-alanine carboxypeptidase [Albidovulum inexpectatum]|uniref:D-alanyl-D-alanine carboxypeptidase n=1 Tax=Albidovulum inexpectatum TaxID=196587 RepID=A0A2S5JL12_9RHOB|nr:D-alanyl-D-alanine carboxypeptidase [Albidovulum inexpectatum]
MGRVSACFGQCTRWTVWAVVLIVVQLAMPLAALAAPYADYVIDARTGEVLHQENANTRLHPASLTKMMTLYIAFEAIEHGEITLDTKVTISRHAASQPPSKLGLRPGQQIALRYLIRAAAIKSANDAATAIAEAIEGSEPAFARRMNRMAKAMGMTRTNFVNANGLTAKGHLSTAHDMTILGRHLFYDYPQYYNLFSRTSADAGIARVYHTNRRFLASYKGADGIKTGYTSAAGFNLTASAQRGSKRVIVTVFGGKSVASRNARVAELMDLGFARSPNRVAVQKPPRPPYSGKVDDDVMVVAEARPGTKTLPAGKVIRLNTAVKVSPRPRPRPGPETAPETEELLLAMQDTIEAVLTEAQDPPEPEEALARTEEPAEPETLPAQTIEMAAAAPATADPEPGFIQETAPQPETLAALAEPNAEISPETPEDPADPVAQAVALALADAKAPESSLRPRPSPFRMAAQTAPGTEQPVEVAEATKAAPAEPDTAPEPTTLASAVTEEPDASAPAETVIATIEPQAEPVATEVRVQPIAPSRPAPLRIRPEQVVLVSSASPASRDQDVPLEVVTRVSTSGGREWAVSVGRFPSSYEAERRLLQIALTETATLDESLRKVVKRSGGYEAQFVGLTRDMAELACLRLQARAVECDVQGP